MTRVPAPADVSAGDRWALDYYNLTSTSETHWPAVPRSGWLLLVDAAARTVRIRVGGGAPDVPAKLDPWLNPHANGQVLPAKAPDCTSIVGGVALSLMCKLPYCSESVRPVAAQQFNVLQLGGRQLYWGERWQSTPTGLKSDDFSYMEPLSFDANGVMQRLNFTQQFELSL